MSSRGSGEKKLELDRRRAQSRLTELSRELAEMETERRTQQKKRARSAIPRVALVGYTNAGKSTIMNSMVMRYLGDAEKTVMEKDMLFATLDTTVRSITPKENKTVLLSDTVGFIDKLPHGLVKAFRSTLSEAASADLLLHVVDFSDPDYKDHIAVTNETLEEIGAADIPVLMVYNKVDRMEESSCLRVTESAVYISAKEESSITLLADEVLKRVYAGHEICHMCLPYARGDIFSYLKEQANVLSESYEADGISVTVECSQADKGRFAEFLV
jgi:GTP-binding protein hflX